MGRLQSSAFLREVTDYVRTVMSFPYMVDRLWVEDHLYTRTGILRVVRVGEYLPYLKQVDGIAIEVLEPYTRFRLVSSKGYMVPELTQEQLAKLISNGFRLKKDWGWEILRWERPPDPVPQPEFHERNEWFSDFHPQFCSPKALVFDIDLVIVDSVLERIVRAYDVKTPFDLGTRYERVGYEILKQLYSIKVKELAGSFEEVRSYIVADLFDLLHFPD